MPSCPSRNVNHNQDNVFGVTRQPSPRLRSGDADDILANVLIRMWALASGRSLRRDVPPALLSVDELIAFWADDMSPSAGRHVRPDGRDRAVGARAVERPASQDVESRSASHRNCTYDRDPKERPAGPAAA